MTDIQKLLEIIQTIKSYCVTLDKLTREHDATYQTETVALEQTATSMNAQLRSQLEKYLDAHLGRIEEQIEAVCSLLRKDYKSKHHSARTNYGKQDEETNVQALYKLIEKLNVEIQGLNNVDFDAIVPPEQISFQEKTFTVTQGAKTTRYFASTPHRTPDKDPKPLNDQAQNIFQLCEEVKACTRAIRASVEARMDLEGYASHIRQCNAQRLQELADSQRRSFEAKFNELFVNEQAKAIPRKFFTDLAEDGVEHSVDHTVVPTDYKEAITIGDLRLLVDDDASHQQYFRQSPILQKHLTDGYMSAPFILDLKTCGNVLLNIDEEVYSDATSDFVNQLIMQFLLSVPANRINFCLVDVENHMNFSRFKSLTKINNDILMNGIIRDDRQLENTIKDIEQIMYKIDDDVLSYNNVPNIFEYNNRYEANPQNIHVFVLVNAPSGLRDDMAKRINKILQGGNRAGIFTIIINNKKATLSPSFKDAEYANFLATVRKHSHVFNKVGNTFTLEMEQKNFFVPSSNIPMDGLQGIIDNMKVAGEKTLNTVVPLSAMFQETDSAIASPTGIPSYAAVLDIPIGARGGEVQNLLLKTTGDGSAHAVIIGGTGSGKSNLLHTIILSACYKYSPEELNLYIVDFKGGVEFEYYEANKIIEKQLPHIKLTGLTSDLEDGVSILSNLHKELRRREEEFKRNQVEDITQYVALGKKIPRLFVIIDEIQELFEQDDRLGQKALDILRELFKKGRAFGINILWASQNVPKTPGLKDKVLSQIGNRISLRLNEPDDALDIKIDPKAVKNLNRPEKGLGVINDIRYGNDCVEFRVAFAESSANRQKYSAMILDKWRSVTARMPYQPLYIVGDDTEPSPMGGSTIYTSKPTQADVVSKAYESYTLQLGQDYVTGKPFDLNLSLMENKQNLLMVGHDAEILRDAMGYSLLSIILNQLTNADCRGTSTKIHCANGDIVTPKNANDLFNVLRNDFAPIMNNASTTGALIDCIRDVYKIYKQRAADADSCEVATAYPPEFVVIHSLQRYVDLINENPVLQLTEAAPQAAPKPVSSAPINSLAFAADCFASASSAPVTSADAGKKNMPASIALCAALNELLDRGGKYNIHFVISVDDPLALTALKNGLNSAMYKVFVKGVSNNVLTQMLGDYRSASALTNPKVAMICYLDERTKVRLYRYEPDADVDWYQKLRDNYRFLLEEMQ